MMSNPIWQRYSLWLALIIAVVVFTSLACANPNASNSNEAAKQTSTPRGVKTVRLAFSVLNETRRPLPDAKIKILGGANTPEASTDNDGKAVFQNFRWDLDKPYTVTVESAGYLSKESRLSEDYMAGKEVIFSLDKDTMQAQTSQAASPSPAPTAAVGVENGENAGSDGKKAGSSPTPTPVPTSTPTSWAFLDMVMWGSAILLVLGIPLFLWLTGERIAFYNVKDHYGLLPKEFETRLKNLEDLTRSTQAQQSRIVNDKLDTILSSIGQLPSRADIYQTERNISALAAQGRGTQGSPDSGYPSRKPNSPPPRRSFREEAHSLYSNLLANGTSSPEPVYLNPEDANSLQDMLVEKIPLLEEVSNSQGAFILFSDGRGQGIVYPNPNLNFRKKVIEKVFPDLTEDTFHYKESITPVLVSKMQDGLWKVEN